MPTGILENPTFRIADAEFLIDERFRLRLVDRVVDDVEFQQYCADLAADARHRLAARVVDQTLRFLWFLADGRSAGSSWAPSPLVDVGWHAFILHTREYFDFCMRMAGQFIHHDPVDDLADGVAPLSVTETVAAMKAGGFVVDGGIWGGIRRKGKGKGKGGGGGGGGGGCGGGGGGGCGGGDGGGGDGGGGGGGCGGGGYSA